MASAPFLTVFLPTYNRPHYLREALASCLRQTYPHFRVIISDDGQTDEVRKIVDSMPSDKVEYRQNIPALGLIKKLNWFLDNCPTEWAVILGDDDWFEPTYLENIAKMIEKYPNAALVRTRYRIINPEGRLLKIDHAEKEVMDPCEAFGSYFQPWYKIHINISGVFFHPRWMKESGGFADYSGGHHVDQVAWTRMLLYGDQIFMQDALVNLRLFDPQAFSRQLDTDVERFMQTKWTVRRDILAIHEALVPRAKTEADRKHLEDGRWLAGEFLSTFIDFHMNTIIIGLLKRRDVKKGEIKKTIGHIRQGMMSSRRFLYFNAIASLPYPMRRVTLAFYLKSRRFWEKMFPPETFTESADMQVLRRISPKPWGIRASKKSGQ